MPPAVRPLCAVAIILSIASNSVAVDQNEEVKSKKKVRTLVKLQRHIGAWSHADYPTPGQETCNDGLRNYSTAANVAFLAMNKKTRSHVQDVQLTLCDPDGLLLAVPSKVERTKTLAAIEDFEMRLGAQKFRSWGTSIAVAVVGDTAEPLRIFAEHTAARWNVTSAGIGGRLLLVLRFNGRPDAVLLGNPSGLSGAASFEPAWSGWRRVAERRAARLLRAGKPGRAVETALGVVSMALTGADVEDSLAGGHRVEQREVTMWKSKYQKFEIYENSCADRICLEFFLDNIRQLSDRFEAYYHESMAFPALNILGRDRARRVLILGGGDFGIATYVLRFRTMERVVVVEIDEDVPATGRKFFPGLSAGFDDERCEYISTDAIAWIKSQKGVSEFDLVIVDFTDDPLVSLFNTQFYRDVQALLSDGGLLVQNMATMQVGELHNLLQLHSSVFGSVFPMSTYAPDYGSPYVLAISGAPGLDPLAVDWSFWEEQNIFTRYYSRTVHEHALFTGIEVSLLRAIGLPMPQAPAAPVPLQGKPPPLPSTDGDGDEKVIKKVKSAFNNIKVGLFDKLCLGTMGGPPTAADCRTLSINGDFVHHRFMSYHYEAMVWPALTKLGTKAKRILALGDGGGGLATEVLKWPHVEQLVIVEIDDQVVRTVREHFPAYKSAPFDDKRTKLVIANALDWLQDEQGEFDAIFVDMTRGVVPSAPRTLAFANRLKSLLTPHGIVVHTAASAAHPIYALSLVDLFRRVFPSVWPLGYSVLDDDLSVSVELDAVFRRPTRFLAMATREPSEAPSGSSIDWSLWARAAVATDLYHPSLHDSFLALPAEWERYFTPPESSTEDYYYYTAEGRQKGAPPQRAEL